MPNVIFSLLIAATSLLALGGLITALQPYFLLGAVRTAALCALPSVGGRGTDSNLKCDVHGCSRLQPFWGPHGSWTPSTWAQAASSRNNYSLQQVFHAGSPAACTGDCILMYCTDHGQLRVHADALKG